MKRLMLSLLAGVVLSAAAALAADPVSTVPIPHATAHSFLEPYFGNTFISRHPDGVEYRVAYSADGHFELVRSGGSDRSADYTMSGTYRIEGNQVCFHPDHPPPHPLTCVPQDQGHKAGERWDFPMSDGGHAIHMIVPGLVLHGPVN